jgi:hypothetical protein
MTNLDTDNVTPLRPAKAKRADNTAALRQRRSRAKRKRVTPVPAAAIAQIAQPEKPNENDVQVTVSQRRNERRRRDSLHRRDCPSRRCGVVLVPRHGRAISGFA